MSAQGAVELLEDGFDPFTPVQIEEHIERAKDLSDRVYHTGFGELPDHMDLAYVMGNLATIVEQLQLEFELLGAKRLEGTELAARVLGKGDAA